MPKYARVRLFSEQYFPHKDIIHDSVLTWKNTGQRSPYSNIFYAVFSKLRIQVFDKFLSFVSLLPYLYQKLQFSPASYQVFLRLIFKTVYLIQDFFCYDLQFLVVFSLFEILVVAVTLCYTSLFPLLLLFDSYFLKTKYYMFEATILLIYFIVIFSRDFLSLLQFFLLNFWLPKIFAYQHKQKLHK